MDYNSFKLVVKRVYLVNNEQLPIWGLINDLRAQEQLVFVRVDKQKQISLDTMRSLVVAIVF